MSANDSSTLIDTPAASKLGENRALYYSEEENRIEKFRPYGLPDESWLASIRERFQQRPALVPANGPVSAPDNGTVSAPDNGPVSAPDTEPISAPVAEA